MSGKFESENAYADYFESIIDIGPAILHDFVIHTSTMNGNSRTTAFYYYRDLILLFRHVLKSRGIVIDLSNIDVHSEYDKLIAILSPYITLDFVRSITKDEILNFFYDSKGKRDNSSATRNRRLSAAKHFFGYLYEEKALLDSNPTYSLHNAKLEKKLPKYLTLNESIKLLDNIPHSKYYSRDYCMITLFLNCGLRISELININMKDIEEDKIRILGKGSKERLVYLNSACLAAIKEYMPDRMSDLYHVKKEYRDALFVSERGNRITYKRVYDIVKECLKAAGLSEKGFSPHKLRHTSATLMYQQGVDIRALKDVLGHESIGTTQIYTHTDTAQIKNASDRNPLANINKYKIHHSDDDSEV